MIIWSYELSRIDWRHSTYSGLSKIRIKYFFGSRIISFLRNCANFEASRHESLTWAVTIHCLLPTLQYNTLEFNPASYGNCHLCQIDSGFEKEKKNVFLQLKCVKDEIANNIILPFEKKSNTLWYEITNKELIIVQRVGVGSGRCSHGSYGCSTVIDYRFSQ